MHARTLLLASIETIQSIVPRPEAKPVEFSDVLIRALLRTLCIAKLLC